MKTICGWTLSAVGVASVCVAVGLAQPEKKAPPADHKAPMAQPDPADMKKMMEMMKQGFDEGRKTGPMHDYLAKSAGTWDGKVKMWMGPTPTESTCVTTVDSMMGGRYVVVHSKGDMEMFGEKFAFEGAGAYGYNTATKTFECTWFDNMSTAMMHGTGTLDAGTKTLTWTLKGDMEPGKGAMTMRETDRMIDDNHMVLEMFGPNPMTGEETKMMEITYTRTAGAGAGHKPDAKK